MIKLYIYIICIPSLYPYATFIYTIYIYIYVVHLDSLNAMVRVLGTIGSPGSLDLWFRAAAQKLAPTTQLWHVRYIHEYRVIHGRYNKGVYIYIYTCIYAHYSLYAALVSGSKTAGGCQSAVHWHECVAGHGGSDQSLRDSRCGCVAGQSYASWIFLANEQRYEVRNTCFFSSSLIKLVIIIASLCFT